MDEEGRVEADLVFMPPEQVEQAREEARELARSDGGKLKLNPVVVII